MVPMPEMSAVVMEPPPVPVLFAEPPPLPVPLELLLAHADMTSERAANARTGTRIPPYFLIMLMASSGLIFLRRKGLRAPLGARLPLVGRSPEGNICATPRRYSSSGGRPRQERS